MDRLSRNGIVVVRHPDGVRTQIGPRTDHHTALPTASRSLLSLQASAGNRAASNLIQTKLVVGRVGDAHEQEADQVAEAVASGQSSHRVDPANLSAMTTPAPVDIEQRIARERSSGRPLPHEVRVDMEHVFGTGLSDVRLHTGREASQLNRRLDSRAFTTGGHIFLGEGRTRVRDGAGRKLLAHELTHVVQQDATASSTPVVQRAGGKGRKRLLNTLTLGLRKVYVANRRRRRVQAEQPQGGWPRYHDEVLANLPRPQARSAGEGPPEEGWPQYLDEVLMPMLSTETRAAHQTEDDDLPALLSSDDSSDASSEGLDELPDTAQSVETWPDWLQRMATDYGPAASVFALELFKRYVTSQANL